MTESGQATNGTQPIEEEEEKEETTIMPPQSFRSAPRRHSWGNERSLRSSIQSVNYPDVRDNPFFNNNHAEAKNRPRRFIGGLIAGILAAFGTTTLFGLFEGEKIDELGKALQTTQEAMIHLLQANSKDIQTNRLALDTLAAAVDGIAKVVETNHWVQKIQTIVIVTRHEIQKVHQALDLYVRVLQAAGQHRLAFGILSKAGAEAALAEITSMAKKQNLAPILANAQQIHQLSTSFVLTEKGLTYLFIYSGVSIIRPGCLSYNVLIFETVQYV